MHPAAFFNALTSAAQMDHSLILIISAFCALLLALILYLINPKLWIAAKLTHTPVTMLEIFAMRLRRVPPRKIIQPMMLASTLGIEVSRKALEAHYLAGGDPEKIVTALLIAKKADLELDFDQTCAVDLTPDSDIVEIVRQAAEKKQS
jgi:uncharacterized protein YqfA (UPF0365 family)